MTSRHHPAAEAGKTCPHCGHDLDGQLVRVHDHVFVCDQCLHEVPTGPRRRRRVTFIHRRRSTGGGRIVVAQRMSNE